MGSWWWIKIQALAYLFHAQVPNQCTCLSSAYCLQLFIGTGCDVLESIPNWDSGTIQKPEPHNTLGVPLFQVYIILWFYTSVKNTVLGFVTATRICNVLWSQVLKEKGKYTYAHRYYYRYRHLELFHLILCQAPYQTLWIQSCILNLTTNIRKRYSIHPHFTNRKAEMQQGWVTCLLLHSWGSSWTHPQDF